VQDGKTAHSFVASLEASSTDPEVPAKPQRRKFNAEDKERILEADDATEHGAIGALLRRDAAVRRAFSQKRGPQPKRNPLAGENEKLRRQNQRKRHSLSR